MLTSRSLSAVMFWRPRGQNWQQSTHTRYPQTFRYENVGEDVQQVVTSLFYNQKLQLVARCKVDRGHVSQAVLKLQKDIVWGWWFSDRTKWLEGIQVQFDKELEPIESVILPKTINIPRLGSEEPITLKLSSVEVYDNDQDDISHIPQELKIPSDTKFTDVSSVLKAYMISGGSIFVPVTLKNIQGYMMLDSGAHVTLIQQSTAEKLGLAGNMGSVKLGIIGDEFMVNLGQLWSLQIGNMQVQNLDIGIVDLKTISGMGPQPMFGLIGAQVFRRMAIELPQIENTRSSETAVVVYDPLRYDAGQIPNKVYWCDLSSYMHAPILQVSIKPFGESQGFTCMLLMDTGYGGNIMLCTRKLKMRRINFDQWPTMGKRQLSASGTVGIDSHIVEEVSFGNLILESLEVTVTDVGTGIDGLMGTGLLKGYNMIIDVPNGKLGFIQHSQKP
eukprot:TRINITY_DN3489_c0_g1_i7.p1 TRINITY_DN3489_c0_g1~~TRINITY_DN3489_c0_g1_i7.p1  ORF type:complete len:444 (-),score=51.43 TRINITY_DN3489_c0_g1_i7:132-1463(-)